jgi:hypothetical protein
MITTIPGEMRLRRRSFGHPFGTIKYQMATHFQMKEQRVEPLCNGSRDRFEKTIDEEAQASRNTGSRMNSQMEDDAQTARAAYGSRSC